MLTFYDKDDEVVMIASSTGSIFDGKLVIHRVFYEKSPNSRLSGFNHVM